MGDSVDTALVDDVLISVESNDQLAYQRLDPWTKNAARRIAKGTFREELLCAALQKHLVPEVLRGYGVDPKDVDLETREALNDRLCGQIVQEAKVLAKTPELIRTFESPQARKYRAELGIGP